MPGGISMGLLSADELDTPLDFESLRKPGCLGLGTAAVTVIDDQTEHRRLPLQYLPLLRPRELRPVHAMPRRNDLVLQDDEADQGRRRPARRPRHHARTSPITWASCPARRSADWPTARPGRSRTAWPSFAASSKNTSELIRPREPGVTPLQDRIAHGSRATDGLPAHRGPLSTAPAAGIHKHRIPRARHRP